MEEDVGDLLGAGGVPDVAEEDGVGDSYDSYIDGGSSVEGGVGEPAAGVERDGGRDDGDLKVGEDGEKAEDVVDGFGEQDAGEGVEVERDEELQNESQPCDEGNQGGDDAGAS